MKAPCLRQAFADIMLLKQPSKFHSENSKPVSGWGCAVQQGLCFRLQVQPHLLQGVLHPGFPAGKPTLKGQDVSPPIGRAEATQGTERTGPQREGLGAWPAVQSPRPRVNGDHLQSKPQDRKASNC